MTENEWTEWIRTELNPVLIPYNLHAETLRRIPYSQEIISYSTDWKPEYVEPIRFETDMVIFEKTDSKITPRIIVEAKIGNITTHDSITYSYKAEKHKSITPYLRYGIMIGDAKNSLLPGRLFRHGTNFDFMFSFVGVHPTQEEWETYTDMLLREVEYSRTIETMLHDSRLKGRKRYYMMQKQLVLFEKENL